MRRGFVKFSYWPGAGLPWNDLLDLCRHVEATGWYGLWFADHFMPNAADVSGPVHEGWALIAGLAAAVPRVRIGALVSGNTYRHPAVLAKTATTADHISGGRVVLGLGAGWQENEHRAYGIEFSDTKGRMERFAEACEIVKRLLTESRTTFKGRHYTLEDAPLEPKPAGPLPLLVGGGGEQVTLRIAAKWADEWNTWGTPEIMKHKNGVLDQRCAEVDRDPSSIARSTQALLFMSDDEAWLQQRRDMQLPMPAIVGTVDQVREIVAAYADAGVDELIVPDFTLGSPERKRDAYDQFIEEVAAPFR